MSVIGLDVGTSRIKAVRFDDTWTAVDSEAEPATVLHGPRGRSEQDMGEVRSAAFRVLRAVAGRSPDAVDVLAVTAQGDGTWLVDAEGEPVGPALLWNDSRSRDQVAGWHRDGTLEQAFRISGCYGAPGLANAQLRWLAEHDAERLAAADTVLSCGSWIHLALTGRRVLEESDAANPFADARIRRYDDGLLELFGLTEHRRLLPPMVGDGDRIAGLTPAAAERLGLPAGTPVAACPYDILTAAIGTGAVEVGQAYAVLGTTLCIGTASADPRLDRAPNGMSLPGARAGQWLIAYATLVGTEVLDWAARMLGVASAAEVVALSGTSFRPDPPLVLPYLSPGGERSPFLDPDIRGSIHGLEISHTPADLARGVLDGLTLAVVDCLAAAGGAESIALCGGGARSRLWCQAISDAAGRPVTLPDTDEVGARGAAMTGAVAAGLVGTLGEAVRLAVPPGEELVPDPAATARYAEAYERLLAVRGE